MGFDERNLTALRAVALGIAGALVAGCGAATPQRAAAPAPAVIAPAAAEPAVEAPRAERNRTRGRRGADAAADTAAQVALDAPPPEAALAAHAEALTALRAADWVEAELALEQVVLEYPDYPGPYVNLAIVYLHDGRTAEARTVLDRALALAPGHAAANTQLGILLRTEGAFAQAETAYRRALESAPDHAIAHYNLGVLLDVYLRRPAEALEHYEQYQASLAAPDETVGRWIIDLRRRLGVAASTPSVAKEDGP